MDGGRLVGEGRTQVCGGRTGVHAAQGVRGRRPGDGVAQPSCRGFRQPLVAPSADAAQQPSGDLGVLLGAQGGGQLVLDLLLFHGEQPPGDFDPYLWRRVVQAGEKGVEEVFGAALRQPLQGPRAGRARALAGGADHLRPHDLVVLAPVEQASGPPPHRRIGVTEEAGQGRGSPGHAQCGKAVQGVDPHMVGRVGQQPAKASVTAGPWSLSRVAAAEARRRT
ncbi:hypothetical protein KEF29_11570 [Streptomyces tuirus]|uniref:Uncharacterized protein n=1 Tax=Streptomyces tuirus TaxID=68278 RepID=A0A941J293_9ACTN|nr:hypothetical protein [Streptomyces tuirus]